MRMEGLGDWTACAGRLVHDCRPNQANVVGAAFAHVEPRTIALPDGLVGHCFAIQMPSRGLCDPPGDKKMLHIPPEWHRATGVLEASSVHPEW